MYSYSLKLSFIIVFLFSILKVQSQEANSLNIKNERLKLNVCSVLCKQYNFNNENYKFKLLEQKLGIKLNNIQAILFAISFNKQLKISENEYFLIKERAKDLAIKFKHDKAHIIFLVDKEKYTFVKIIRSSDGSADYLLSSDVFLMYKKMSNWFVEIANIFDENSRF